MSQNSKTIFFFFTKSLELKSHITESLFQLFQWTCHQINLYRTRSEYSLNFTLCSRLKALLELQLQPKTLLGLIAQRNNVKLKQEAEVQGESLKPCWWLSDLSPCAQTSAGRQEEILSNGEIKDRQVRIIQEIYRKDQAGKYEVFSLRKKGLIWGLSSDRTNVAMETSEKLCTIIQISVIVKNSSFFRTQILFIYLSKFYY